jgi:hypothetical protein
VIGGARALEARWRPGGRLAGVAVAGLALAALGGCAADRIEGGVFRSVKGYRVTLPGSGWEVAPRGEADLVLRRPAPPGGMLADATCEPKAAGRPLGVLARHLVFGLTERRAVSRDAATVGGRPAVRTVVEGRRDGVPVQVEAVVVTDERCVYDFVYVAPRGHFAPGREAFRRFVESFERAAAGDGP